MEAFNFIDSLVLRKFQEVSDRIREFSGLDNFILVKILLGLLILVRMHIILFSFLSAVTVVEEMVIGVFMIISAGIILSNLNNFEIKTKKSLNKTNPGIILFKRLRIMSLFLVVITIMALPSVIFVPENNYFLRINSVSSEVENIILFLSIYLSCCTSKWSEYEKENW